MTIEISDIQIPLMWGQRYVSAGEYLIRAPPTSPVPIPYVESPIESPVHAPWED